MIFIDMKEIKNLKKAAVLIKKTLASRGKIIIFGDADLDGSTSALLLEETIKNIDPSADLLVYFSEWESEDYGLNKQALQALQVHAPALLIAVDCGIGNFAELLAAKALGFTTIVIDHHEILHALPAADLIIDPKQKGDSYPFKKLTTVCLVYKLSELLLGKGFNSFLQQSFAEMAALGTIADMMPEEDLNAVLVGQGAATIKQTQRPGLRAIIQAAMLGENSAREIFKKLALILNISPVVGHLTECYLLLKAASMEEALALAKKLLIEADKRNQEIYQITEIVSQMAGQSSSPIIFVGEASWPRVFSGAVASRICNKLKKPTFIFKRDTVKCRGSVRVPKNIDAVAALKSCSSLLTMYGGHPPAAGFTVPTENVDKLEECLEKYFNEMHGKNNY